MIDRFENDWRDVKNIYSVRFTCGYCGTDTSPANGWFSQPDPLGYIGYVALCTNCNRPSFVEVRSGNVIATTPAHLMGNEVSGLPENVRELYTEARNCTSVGAFTATVLVCRKLLMHITVEKGALPNLAFIDYVQYLADKSYIPPDGKEWVDHIRTKSNEANHEIVVMSSDDAKDLLSFIEMLLRLVYEFKEPPRQTKTMTK